MEREVDNEKGYRDTGDLLSYRDGEIQSYITYEE